ncbi:hypothetical protein [Clostridium polynesiense]|uniref:hypothetical protein n=1 Tax=Clostridium polynesiense TaxID=1325933 RepID=UPI0005915E7B|nr:hypothetical protein [Clostridium polynesiense]
MKLKVNRKQLGVTLILIGLMIVLFSSQKIFEIRFKEAALINTDMSVMKVIKGIEGKINYKLPENWEVKDRKYPDDTILYHTEYKSPDSVINGYISVFEGNEDVNKAVEKDKKLLQSIYAVKDYTAYRITMNKRDVLKVQYDFKSQKSEEYTAQEYYMKYEDYTVKFAFYVVKDKYKENMVVAFNAVVESFGIK